MDELGGAVAAVEQGFVQGEIEEAAFRYAQEVESGERVIVGVNRYEEAEPEPIELHRIDPEAERRQLERTARVRAERDAAAAEVALARGARGGARDAEPAPAAARGAARALHHRRDLQRPARRVRHVRRAARAVRILLVSQMYPGPADPDLGVFVAQLERALRERGHELERAVLDSRGGGKRRYAMLAMRTLRAARRFKPDVVYAHFLVPSGLLGRRGRQGAARRDRARARRSQRRRDPRGRRRRPARPCATPRL